MRKITITEEDELYEMSNIRPEDDSGLPMVVWAQESEGKEKHYMRLKVSTKYGNKLSMSQGFFTITIPDLKVIGDTGDIKNSDIQLVKNWIVLNQDLLIDLWKGEISSKTFLNSMKSI